MYSALSCKGPPSRLLIRNHVPIILSTLTSVGSRDYIAQLKVSYTIFFEVNVRYLDTNCIRAALKQLQRGLDFSQISTETVTHLREGDMKG